jgi:hypothetical protein
MVDRASMRIIRGFTLIELLVVVTVIMLLAGLIVGSIAAFKRTTLKARTEAILGGIRVALATTAAERGGSIAAVEHPLCGSASPRPSFVRADGSAPVNASGEALIVQEISWVDPGEQSRVLLGDDLYSGGDAGTCELPLLFGMPRKRIGVLGASTEAVTSYRRLPALHTGFDDDSAKHLRLPYDGTVYPDRVYLVTARLPAGSTIETASDKAIGYALAGARNEILQLGGIFAGLSDGGIPIMNQRVWQANSSPEAPAWRPGHVKDGLAWKRYRLRGTAVYDAWGNEIIFSIGANEAVRLESAGADGVFCMHPGLDGIYQSKAACLEAEGDDRDGRRDNIGARTRE